MPNGCQEHKRLQRWQGDFCAFITTVLSKCPPEHPAWMRIRTLRDALKEKPSTVLSPVFVSGPLPGFEYCNS